MKEKKQERGIVVVVIIAVTNDKDCLFVGVGVDGRDGEW